MKANKTGHESYYTLGEYAEKFDHKLHRLTLDQGTAIIEIAIDLSVVAGQPIKTRAGKGIKTGRVAKRFRLGIIIKAVEQYQTKLQ